MCLYIIQLLLDHYQQRLPEVKSPLEKKFVTEQIHHYKNLQVKHIN